MHGVGLPLREIEAVGGVVGEGMNVGASGAGEDTTPHPRVINVIIKMTAARVGLAKDLGIRRQLAF